MSDDFAQHMEAVATALLGKPASRKSKELRYGRNGSFKVNLESGFWDDWESGDGGKGRGGGVLALIKREKGLDAKEAIAWMRDSLGLDVGHRSGSVRSEHQDTRPEPPPLDGPTQDPAPKKKPKIVKTYDYVDRDGKFLFQVCRTEPKGFMQRRRPRPEDKPEDIKNGWVWKRDGITMVPYRLPDLLEALGDDRLIFYCEGEKDTDNLLALGVPATTSAGGAGKWPDELTEYFRGADVVILPDNDPQTRKRNPDGSEGELLWHPDGRPKLPGQDHALLVASKLDGVAARVRIMPLPNLPVKGDTTDWLEAGSDSSQLYKLVETHTLSPQVYRDVLDEVFKPREFVSKFGAVVWGEPVKTRTRYEYLIKGLIPRKESVLIYGASQSGKSFFTQDFCMAVALGGDDKGEYCGRKVMQGGVIYCAPEGGVGFVDKRMPAYAKGKQIPLDKWQPFICMTKKFDLFGDEKQLNELIEEGKYWKAYFAERGIKLELFVIDTLNKVTPAMDEISGKDVGTVLKRLDRIKEELDTGIILVHHKNAAGTGPRGHTSLYAAFETAVEVGRTGEIWPCPEIDASGREYTVAREKRFTLQQKQREGEDGARAFFYLRGIELGTDDDGETIPCCVVEWITKDQSPRARRQQVMEQRVEQLTTEKLSPQGRALYLALKKAIEDYGVVPPPELQLPRSVTRVVDIKYWRQAWKSRADDAKPDAVRKALERQNDILQNKGWIGRSNPWVWVTDKEARYRARQQQQQDGSNVVPFPGTQPAPDVDFAEMNDPQPGGADDELITT